jgi:hypothetical protein
LPDRLAGLVGNNGVDADGDVPQDEEVKGARLEAWSRGESLPGKN